MSSTLRIKQTAARPVIELWLRDKNSSLIDFSSGYTFSFKIGNAGSTAALTKTSGISGAAGSGDEPDGTPNVTITPSAGEFSSLTPGPYEWQLTATTSSLPRVFGGTIDILSVIS